MKLFYDPHACSLGIHILLEEIGKPFELKLVDLAKGEQYGLELPRSTQSQRCRCCRLARAFDAHLQRMRARPAVQRALATEGLA